MNWINRHTAKARMMAESKKNLLFFAVILSAICAILSLLEFKAGRSTEAFILASLALFILISYYTCHIKRFYLIWMIVVQIIGEIISTLVLALIFFLILSPLGFVKRMSSQSKSQGWEDKTEFSKFEEMY